MALSVAAEFWEQGDLERTVLQQQPIVSLLLLEPSLSKVSYMIYILQVIMMTGEVKLSEFLLNIN